MANDRENIKKDIEELRATLDKLASDVSSISNTMAGDLKARVNLSADDLRDNAQTTARKISEKGQEAMDTMEQTVRDKPFQSLMVAFGAGLLLAQFFHQR